MNLLAARLTSVQAVKHLLRTSQVASIAPAATTYYHQHIAKGVSESLQHNPRFDGNIQKNFAHYDSYSEEQSHYGSDHWIHGIIVVSVLVGSAVFHAVSALCEKEEEDVGVTREDSQIEGFSVAELRNLDLKKAENFEEALQKARIVLRRKMNVVGSPGLVASVSVDGKTVWAEGFGYADVENSVPCTPKSVMRIASISKPITMTALAKLWEKGKIDLDAPVQKYVPYFPVKKYEGEEVTITTRHLLCHKSGIRHYSLKDPIKKKNDKQKCNVNKQTGIKAVEDSSKCTEKASSDEKDQTESKARTLVDELSSKRQEIPEKEGKSEESSASEEKPVESKNPESPSTKVKKRRQAIKQYVLRLGDKEKKEDKINEFDLFEYHIRETFHTIEDSVKLFMDDDLFFKPGTDFLYTTHGYTLVSAVIEGVSGKPFTSVMRNLFHELGLSNTYLDEPSKIIYNRSNNYRRDKAGRLVNAPYVDNSYKWAGGGFLSTVEDLTKFGNIMLYSSQRNNTTQGSSGKDSLKLGYLQASTVKQLWTPVSGTKMGWDCDGGYGLGWGAVEEQQCYGFCSEVRRYASHTGGAVGASSVLLILPDKNEDDTDSIPKGVVVTLIANLQNVGLNAEALVIAKLFEDAHKNLCNKSSSQM